MYRTLLFDFDGTLVPSLDLWLQAFRYSLSQFGRELPDETIIKRFYFRQWDEICTEFDLPSPDLLRDHVFDGLTISFEKAVPYDGILDLVTGARRRGCATGIVTTSPRLQIVTVIDRLGIGGLFDTVVTGDDVTRWKPDPEPVLKAISDLGAAASETLFVGDYLVDVVAGKAAGTATALFMPDSHRRFYDFDKLYATEPDFAFSRYSELAEWLDGG